ncbi:inositol monophosphatase family protein [Hyphococcus flavus]|uniref:Inositol monophosphatase family protein n=1 Tax=Hyphococcus flavus TaxID=1866326 RepID=A0AAF0CHX1_9PROT|nr:inositol monophosphatase family protein [Hyphococcus flavus]WDI32337.1 inositol monophosphatase family protein [Hyphococcus flavus]
MSFTPQDLSEFAAFANRLADAARLKTLPRFRNGIPIVNKLEETPGDDFDPVTDADREGERAIRDLIETTYPEHGILGEEFEERAGKSAWRWILDPVDGTRAFVCGCATWTTLIALEREGEPVLGLIDQPFINERWVGFSSSVTYSVGGKDVNARTSGVRELAAARISTTDPLASAYYSEKEAQSFARVNAASRVARFSMDAYAYGLLAIGELDLVLETCLKRHDYAALIPIVEGAGGVVTNWRGHAVGTDDRGEVIAAATPELHEAALKLLTT